MSRKIIGRYILADARIRDGQPILRGTEITVQKLLEDLAGGTAWETLIERSEGALTADAIAEAVRLAGMALLDHLTQGTITGEHLVADPHVCHGAPTFRGTRVMVSLVLPLLERGAMWERILSEWPGSFGEQAIAEVLRRAGQALAAHADDYVVELVSA